MSLFTKWRTDKGDNVNCSGRPLRGGNVKIIYGGQPNPLSKRPPTDVLSSRCFCDLIYKTLRRIYTKHHCGGIINLSPLGTRAINQ